MTGAAGFGRHTVIDSSQSLARFPKETAAQLFDVMLAACQAAGACIKSIEPSNCFTVPSGQDPSQHFPTLTFLFRAAGGGEARVSWEPKDYVCKSAPTLWCVSFDAHDSDETILGAGWLVGRNVSFVLEEPIYLATQGVTELSWAQRYKLEYIAAALVLGVGTAAFLLFRRKLAVRSRAHFLDVPLHPRSVHAYGPHS
mmetsp:Transcript_73288/g.143783  ORF Transcript_73288/g.143783 Transcript_73288/m.143783 type:complete len:198 (-) Transcript_73288:105-698(-)